ncbi:MAG: hypothetical protein RR922_04275 [Clostridia bacterium]
MKDKEIRNTVKIYTQIIYILQIIAIVMSTLSLIIKGYLTGISIIAIIIALVLSVPHFFASTYLAIKYSKEMKAGKKETDKKKILADELKQVKTNQIFMLLCILYMVATLVLFNFMKI